MAMIAAITGVLAVMGGWAIAAQDKYTVKLPNGLAFSEFRGFEDRQAVGPESDRRSKRDQTHPWRIP